jgi:hypothetical protein
MHTAKSCAQTLSLGLPIIASTTYMVHDAAQQLQILPLRAYDFGFYNDGIVIGSYNRSSTTDVHSTVQPALLSRPTRHYDLLPKLFGTRHYCGMKTLHEHS